MPQVFEFHFNPPKQNRIATGKDDLIFDSFCFEPKNVYEKRLGDLSMVGLLKNVLPKNIGFLDVLAQRIKEKYYLTPSSTPEKSLRDALRMANEHLEKIAKKGDVSWLGNLSFAVISLTPHHFTGGGELNFTKVGDLKLFLIRKGQLIDIDQKLNFDDIEPYPLKIFGNIVSGKLIENDIILVLSKGAYDVFLRENLLNEIAKKPEIKKFKNILNGKKEQLTKTSGICLLMVLSKEATMKEKETFSGQKALKIFSPKEVFRPLIKIIKNFRIPKPRIPMPKISLPKIKLPIFYKFSSGLKRKIILVLVLIVFLIFGFFVSEKREEEKIKTYQIQIEQIQEKINRAESYLILAEYSPQAKEDANILYKEIWNEISPLANISSSLPSIIAIQLLDLKSIVSKNLYQLNKLMEISEPELIFEFKTREFIPQKLISFGDKIYFFTPYSENIFELNGEEKTGKIIEASQKITESALLPESVLFFSKPNQIIPLRKDQPQEPVYLQEPYPEFDFVGFSSYRSNLYFLDNKNGQIVRYPFISKTPTLTFGDPELWLSRETKTATDFESMAVDGSVWILTKKNAIERYYTGNFQETIALEIFPESKNFSKIFTTSQHPELYILEPAQKRIIILDKAGQIIRQFQSEKFDNLLDFSVSEDGKTIWLLNGLTLYQINI